MLVQRQMGFSPSVIATRCQLPSAVACCLQPATSRCESYGFQHRAAETLLKVEIPMWDFKSALPTADGKIKDFAAAPQGLRCVPSGGAIERRNPCLPLMRKVSARLVAMTEGESYVSFEILNQWISKRESEISSNRTETQNPRPLNQLGRGFVFYNTAVAAGGLSPQT